MSYVALDIFQQLRPVDIHWMLATAELRTIAPNGVLVREDDPPETIFFVADGLFEAYIYGHSTRQLRVGQLGPGEIVGEISWLDGKPISATVRALETSSVIALSIPTLERKLAEDPAFAARFFRAVATLEAKRLRTTTAQVPHDELTAERQGAFAGSADAASILESIGELRRVAEAAHVRADAGTAAQVATALSALERSFGTGAPGIAAKLAESLQSELLPLLRLSALGERLHAKPRGYAGDYRTIAMIYQDTPSGTGPLGPLLDRSMLNLPVAKAIRNRRRMLASEITKSYAATAKEFYVACLACGPACEVFDAFRDLSDSRRLNVSCVDIDREALAQIADRARAQKLSGQLQPLHGNLIYLATGRQELELASQDLIYSLNITDYLSDDLAVSLLDWIHAKLRPGGRAIVGNFHPRNPSRGLMDHVLEWRLVYRDEAAVNRLFQASRFAKPCSRIAFEEEGIYLLGECAK
ncbi:MAG TPA: cyclic nucleotide-binding domain-containing protein [Hyphomicrobiaceae bacterium]|nr:cyclic nucleotide-binding domain-containing protein [Hyphomicrobiaceae bacterium]